MLSSAIQAKLAELGISLPPVAVPAAAYLPWVGQLGKDTDTATGQAAARAVAIDLLGTLQAATGDLGKVVRIVKVMSLVNSTADFTEQHLVTNGASELLATVLGDAGKHARSAFGVAQIPLGACVEIELIAEVRD
jgi:enamine deaminase RidA (YjgF/YER057c/UK114 family)